MFGKYIWYSSGTKEMSGKEREMKNWERRGEN
jgi:hypothetical protein